LIFILLTLPDHDDLTRYASAWSEKILLDTAERVGIKPIIVKGKNVVRSHITQNINSKNPKFLFFNGHGSSTCIGGYGTEKLIVLGENDSLLNNKIVHVLACNAGMDLGKNCKAKAFIGYRGNFWLCMDRFSLSRPLEDKLAAPVMISALEAPNQLLKRKEPKEAFEMSQEVYDKWIFEYTHSESKYTTEELQLILPVLFVNKILQVLYEKENSSTN
jgi:hypothetical protein